MLTDGHSKGYERIWEYFVGYFMEIIQLWRRLVLKSFSCDNHCLGNAKVTCGPCPAAPVRCMCVWKCSSESVRAVCDLTSPGRKVKLSGRLNAEPRSVQTTFISYITYLSLSLLDRDYRGKASRRRKDVSVASYVISQRRINLNYAVRIVRHKRSRNEKCGMCDSQLRLYLDLVMLPYM
jgi:hypothetical protein